MASNFGDKTKRNRKLLTLQEKLTLISFSEQGMSMTDIGRKLGIPRSTVSTIVKTKARVLEDFKNATPLHTKVYRKRDNLIAGMEKLLNTWIQEQNSLNLPLSQSLIQAKALRVFNTMKAERGESSAAEKFGASRGWFNRFKTRFNLHYIKVQEEPARAESESAEVYPSGLEKLIEDCGYSMQQIFNVDENLWKKKQAGTFTLEEKKPKQESNYLKSHSREEENANAEEENANAEVGEFVSMNESDIKVEVGDIHFNGDEDSEQDRSSLSPISKRNMEEESYEDESSLQYATNSRPVDDSQVFGDFVASELRNLRTGDNRRKLRRLIQKAILQISELDDLDGNCNTASS